MIVCKRSTTGEGPSVYVHIREMLSIRVVNKLLS